MAGIASAALLAGAADIAADLPGKVRAGIAEDARDMRGIVCLETVERTRYAPRRSDPAATCGDLIAAASNATRGSAQWRSRLRLNVTAGPAAEQFALTGAGRFESSDVGGILRAADAGGGGFSAFLGAVAGVGAFQARGIQATPRGRLAAFGFTLSLPSGARGAGTIYADPESGDLERLTLETGESGGVCRVQYTTDYTDTRVEERDLILPQSSTTETIYRDGTELHSETWYSGYMRPPVKAVTPSAGDSAKPLPPGVRLRVVFNPPIESQTAATGDPVVGVIRATVKDKSGVIARAGDRLHGRIALIEEDLTPAPQWNLAIVFDTIERGGGGRATDGGVEQPVSLAPLDDGDRLAHGGSPSEELRGLRPPGGGYFIFHDSNVVLDQTFETRWETR